MELSTSTDAPKPVRFLVGVGAVDDILDLVMAKSFLLVIGNCILNKTVLENLIENA